MRPLFTVVIAAQKYITDITETYSLFLRPFRDDSNITFIPWDPDAENLSGLLGKLSNIVAAHPKWRAIVIADDKCKEEFNPFDRFKPSADIDENDVKPEPSLSMAEEFESKIREIRENIENGNKGDDGVNRTTEEEVRILAAKLDRQYELKKIAFDEAAKSTFVHLVTNLCEQPHVEGSVLGVDIDEANVVELKDYLIRKESQREALYKQELREKILSENADIKFAYPVSLYCLALRTHSIAETDLQSAWSEHVNYDYSRFYDCNLYYDRMRYLVFDILPENHKNYASDYIRFLSILLVMASNKIPSGAISPHKVYSINCVNDDELLGKELAAYDYKLQITYDKLEADIAEINNKIAAKANNKTVDSIIQTTVSVPVEFDSDIDKRGLYPDPKAHWATDVTTSEEEMWMSTYKGIQGTLHKMLKQPKRAIFKAANYMRESSTVDSENCRFLNDFQLSDIKSHISDEEMGMADAEVVNFFDISVYRDRMEKEKAKVDKKLDSRIDKAKIFAIGGSGLLLLLISFCPLILSNLDDMRTRSFAVLITVLSLIAFVLVAGIAVLVFRHGMKNALETFNDTMRQICGEIENGMRKAGQYLEHVCSVMRCYSAINYGKEHVSADNIKVGIYRKHQNDIREKQTMLYEKCKNLLPEDRQDMRFDEEPYDEDFSKKVTYKYDIPYIENVKNRISFMQEEERIYVPVDFIKKITIKMEEQYD